MSQRPEASADVLAERAYWQEKKVDNMDDRVAKEIGHLIQENKQQSKMIYIGFGLAVAVNFIAPFFGKV